MYNITHKITGEPIYTDEDLSGSRLACADMVDMDFSYKWIEKAVFDWASMDNINLTGSIIFLCSFKQAVMIDAVMERAELESCDFRGANMQNVNAREAMFEDSVLYNADLRNADLRFARFMFADLRYASMDGAKIDGADFRFAVGNGKEVYTMILAGLHIVFWGPFMSINSTTINVDGWLSEDYLKKTLIKHVSENATENATESVKNVDYDWIVELCMGVIKKRIDMLSRY